MKIGFYNLGKCEMTLGMAIIFNRLVDAGYNPIWLDLDAGFNPQDFDILCFSIYWWELKLTYIKFLKDFGINPEKRKPILILGGLEMLNPIPMERFFHYAVLGDGEEIIVPLVKAIEKKEEVEIDGVYIPGQSKKINIQSTLHLEPKQYIDLRISKQTRIEIARGCKQHCLFCLMRWVKPYRELNGETLRILIQTAKTKNVALFSPDIGSHSNYEDLLDWCKKYGKRNTATDLRIDTAYKLKTINNLRFGLEGFSYRIRKALGKDWSTEKMVEYFRHIFEETKTPKGKPITVITMYVILGLPGEKPEDIKELIDLLGKIDHIAKYKFTLFLTFNTFSPYFFTPFQWAEVNIFEKWNDAWKKRDRRFENIVIAKRGGFRSPSEQLKHLLTVRGDERASKLLFNIATNREISGKIENFYYFKLILNKCGINIEELIEEIPINKVLPYDMIENKISKDNLYRMWENYKERIFNG